MLGMISKTNIKTRDASNALISYKITMVLQDRCQGLGAETNIYIFSMISQRNERNGYNNIVDTF